MKRILTILLPLLIAFPVLGQIAFQFTDLQYMYQRPAAAGGVSLPALPQSGNITMYWDSEVSPQAKTIVWRDLTNNVPIVATYSNSAFMYNTPDGMIMSSGVIGGNGQGIIAPEKTLGTNWSVWFTVKREDSFTSKKIAFASGNAEVQNDVSWDHFWNMASPSRITPTSNHFVGRWTDILITQTNNADYTAYYDGVYMTNQPRSAATSLRDFGITYSVYPNLIRYGQVVVWTNKVLTAAEALTLHQRMTNQMPNTPIMSNALPSFITSGTGLRHAFRTAGRRGRVGDTWTDSFTGGNAFTARIDKASQPDYEIIASDRGMRFWSSDAGFNPVNGWTGGSATFPNPNYTFFLTVTLSTAGYTSQGYVFISYGGAEFRIDNPEARIKQGSGTFMSPTLNYNQTYTLMSAHSAGGTTNYIDGVYYNTGSSFAGETMQGFCTLQFSPYNTWGGNFNGWIGEFILCTNVFSTNDAVAYHQYATNQYKFDYNDITNTAAVATNQYGYYFMPCNSNLWASPILQQQTNDIDYSNFSVAGNTWGHQKIHNTSATEVRIKNIRLKLGEVGGANINVYAYVAKTNYNGYVASLGRPYPDITPTYSQTNTITASAAAAWIDFPFSAVDTPIIPAGQDFYIIWAGTGSGAITTRQSYLNPYENNTEYYFQHASDDFGPNNNDACFEIYTCQ